MDSLTDVGSFKPSSGSTVDVTVVTTCSLFCDPDADVTFKSSDDILFKIYGKHLATASAGFAIPESTSVDTSEPVILQETSQVLEVLFQFIHPRSEADQYRQPSVVDMEVDLFFDLAEAAEKYLVHGVMNICLMRMQLSLFISKPIQVLNHAVKHGYDSLADMAAPATVSLPIGQVADGLTFPGLMTTWVKYFDRWLQVAKQMADLLQTSPYRQCKRLSDLIRTFMLSKILDPRCTQVIGHTNVACQYNANVDQCQCKALQLFVDERVRAIPKFSEIF